MMQALGLEGMGDSRCPYPNEPLLILIMALGRIRPGSDRASTGSALVEGARYPHGASGISIQKQEAALLGRLLLLF
jgi:hypothetical protein